MDDYYRDHRASVHRGVYPLAAEATELFEGARDADRRVRRLDAARDTIFTRNATEAINLVAYALGPRQRRRRRPRRRSREMEHHSNIVPWQMLASEAARAAPRSPVDDDGRARPRRARRAARRRRRRSSPSRTSPTCVGTINPVAEIVAPRPRRRRA